MRKDMIHFQGYANREACYNYGIQRKTKYKPGDRKRYSHDDAAGVLLLGLHGQSVVNPLSVLAIVIYAPVCKTFYFVH